MGIRRRGHPVCSSARSTRNVIRSAEIHLREAGRFLTVRLIVIIIPTAALSVLSPDVNHSPTRTNWSTSSQEPRHKKLDIQRNTTTTTQETSPHTKYYPKGDTIFIVPGTSLPSKDTIVRDTPPDHRPRYQAPRKTLPHKTPPNKPSPFNTAVKETPSSDHPQGINCSTMERDLDNLLDEIRRGSSSATTPAKNGPRGNSTTRSVTGTNTGATGRTGRTLHPVDRQNTRMNDRSSNTSSTVQTPMERFEAENFTDGPWHTIDGVSGSGSGSV